MINPFHKYNEQISDSAFSVRADGVLLNNGEETNFNFELRGGRLICRVTKAFILCSYNDSNSNAVKNFIRRFVEC